MQMKSAIQEFRRIGERMISMAEKLMPNPKEDEKISEKDEKDMKKEKKDDKDEKKMPKKVFFDHLVYFNTVIMFLDPNFMYYKTKG